MPIRQCLLYYILPHLIIRLIQYSKMIYASRQNEQSPEWGDNNRPVENQNAGMRHKKRYFGDMADELNQTLLHTHHVHQALLPHTVCR